MPAATRRNRFVALLRGINVGGHNKIKMADLRSMTEEFGYENVQTYIQSGNLLFEAKEAKARVASALESAIEDTFGFGVPVIVRTAQEIRKARAGCPFEDVVNERPALVHAGFAKKRIAPSAKKALEPYCKAGERIAVKGQVIWIDYKGGVARTKLTPAVLDREFGSTVTGRNIKTLDKLIELC